VIDEGVNGVIVDSVEEAVEAVEQVKSMSRPACRNAFEQRFTVRRMADDYLRLYEGLIGNRLLLEEAPLPAMSVSEEQNVAEDAA